MIYKTFKNEELGIEMNSFFDNNQNVWFKGKDVAQILGYKDTDDAARRHVSTENKMIHLLHPNSWVNKMAVEENVAPVKHQVKKITPGALKRGVNKMPPGVAKRHLNKMPLEGNIVHLLMSLVFMNLYLVLN